MSTSSKGYNLSDKVRLMDKKVRNAKEDYKLEVSKSEHWWEGEAYSAFRGVNSKTLQKINSVNVDLGSLATELRNLAGKMQNADDKKKLEKIGGAR